MTGRDQGVYVYVCYELVISMEQTVCQNPQKKRNETKARSESNRIRIEIELEFESNSKGFEL